jgi:methylase of polypeptide subunit release factors
MNHSRHDTAHPTPGDLLTPSDPATPPSPLLPGSGLRWLSTDGGPPPERLVEVDDRITADAAYRYAARRIGLLWHGDYRNARQLLTALGRRATPRRRRPVSPASPAEDFRRYRTDQSRRARTLNMLLVPIEPDFSVALHRAPDVRAACAAAYPPVDGPAAVALRELLGVVGAHEWRIRGVAVPSLDARVHPHYGVFAPTRGEYVDLVAEAPLATPPAHSRAFDIGTGTGVLAALLVRRGMPQVVATDVEPRAVACARDNLGRLGMADRVQVLRVGLFPPGRADLVVCNPPWLPGRPHSTLDRAVYDPGSRMLHGFLGGLGDHLRPAGEGWLVLSDLAELLRLRTRGELDDAIEAAGLRVAGRTEIHTRHQHPLDPGDPLHDARAAEVTSLWRLVSR